MPLLSNRGLSVACFSAGTLLWNCSEETADPAINSASSATGSVGSGGNDGGRGGTSESAGGQTTATGGGQDGAGGTPCVPNDVLATLQKHLDALEVTADAMASHPGPSEATGFLLAPGLPSPPAVANTFAGPLVEVCSRPLEYVPYCNEGACSQIECTGAGASWIMHHYLDDPIPVVSEQWAFVEVNVDSHWMDGASGILFTIQVDATGPAERDWSMSGEGQMDIDLLQVEETFSALFDGGPARLTFQSIGGRKQGSLVLDGVTLATASSSGQFEATEECPP